jgi:hypothetical protein
MGCDNPLFLRNFDLFSPVDRLLEYFRDRKFYIRRHGACKLEMAQGVSWIRTGTVHIAPSITRLHRSIGHPLTAGVYPSSSHRELTRHAPHVAMCWVVQCTEGRLRASGLESSDEAQGFLPRAGVTSNPRRYLHFCTVASRVVGCERSDNESGLRVGASRITARWARGNALAA